MGLSVFNLIPIQEILCRAMIATANNGFKPTKLPAGNQSKRATARTGQHGPIRVPCIPHGSSIFQHKECSRLHLFWYPFFKPLQFSGHHALLGFAFLVLLRRLNSGITPSVLFPVPSFCFWPDLRSSSGPGPEPASNPFGDASLHPLNISTASAGWCCA